MKRRFCCRGSGRIHHLAEVQRVDVQNRRGRFRMVKDVRRVHAEKQSLAFADLERLRQVRIKPPEAWTFNRSQSHVAPLSGLRILEKNLPGGGIGDCSES